MKALLDYITNMLAQWNHPKCKENKLIYNSSFKISNSNEVRETDRSGDSGTCKETEQGCIENAVFVQNSKNRPLVDILENRTNLHVMAVITEASKQRRGPQNFAVLGNPSLHHLQPKDEARLNRVSPKEGEFLQTCWTQQNLCIQHKKPPR
ncbi:hypothetical protein F3Y22_tig00110482pilonHSYRG00542 [Hibiscus syriacus]|uniref:Uncharacterized protein n=1 Tax=Hibiscus syriacus TaxID=106335 RepID=A0A6A3AIA9_HIBSY|nr:hypothetical protein F3Y22_tig00110482pilonHSYRG00542 [Hibiscus syriacus]